MGKRTKHIQPLPTERPKLSRQCDWCNLPHDEGSLWEGQWVCSDCFPVESLNKKLEEKKKKTCDSCGNKKSEGGLLLTKWVCSDCFSLFGLFGNKKKGHKNKYAHLSNVDRHQPKRCIQPMTLVKKPRKKDKKNKLKRIEHWVVVITDISDGKL